MSKVIASLCFRRYGMHKTIKRITLPGQWSDYVNDKLVDSRDCCAVHEDKVLEDLPNKFLPVPPESVLLAAKGTGMFCTARFRSWAKYFDSYSLHIDKEEDVS